MNTLQALAVAAAALAISGDPWGSYLARAEAHVIEIAARAEMLVSEFTIEVTETAVAEEPCAEADSEDSEDWAKRKHGLPDTSIHSAVRAARL